MIRTAIASGALALLAAAPALAHETGAAHAHPHGSPLLSVLLIGLVMALGALLEFRGRGRG